MAASIIVQRNNKPELKTIERIFLTSNALYLGIFVSLKRVICKAYLLGQ